MIYKVVFFLIIIAWLSILTACKTTPETPPMVNRAGGLPERIIIDPISENQIKEIEAPSYWKETLTRREGMIVINADIEVIKPTISNTPILELQQFAFPEAFLKELVIYFTKEKELFKIPLMTKNELMEELYDIESYKGYYNSPLASFNRTKVMNRIIELAERAPAEIGWESAKVEFVFPSFNDVDYIARGERNEKEVENTIEVLVRTDDNFDSLIKATKYNADVGSASKFYYTRGIIYKEEDWLRDYDILELYSSWQDVPMMNSINRIEDEWIIEEKQWLDKIHEKLKFTNITYDRAEKLAQEVITDLGINGMMLTDCTPGIQFLSGDYKQFEMNKLNYDPCEANVGYTLTYFRELSGLPGCRLTNGKITIGSNSIPGGNTELMFPNTPPFFTEYISIFVTEEGVQMFQWENLSQPIKIVAENTMLMPFSEIINRFADHINFTTYPEGSEQFDIYNVELRSAYCPAFEAPDHAWLIPVWVFEYRNYYLPMNDSLGEEIVYMGIGQSQFSAIDGGYVAPADGMIQVFQN